MSSKHTPGPWIAYEIAPDDPEWGACEIWPDENDREDEEGTVKPVATMVMGVENARLIAAAPELLEALSKAVRETEQFLFDAWLVRVCPSGDVESVQRQWLASSDHRDFVDEWREQIDAIAKATGGAQ